MFLIRQVFVPRPSGIGWTLNGADPAAWIAFSALVIVALAFL